VAVASREDVEYDRHLYLRCVDAYGARPTELADELVALAAELVIGVRRL
jgi:hypothetical protein